MNKTFAGRASLVVVASLLLSLLAVTSGCSSSNAGGCNACPQVDEPITAEQCKAAGAAAGCATVELVDVPGDAGLAACGAGVPYQACNWTNCNGKVDPCVSLPN